MSRGEELEALYREQGARLWWAILAYAGDRDVASDAVSEAFAQALARGPGVRNPAAWIWKAAFKIAAGELKRRRRALPFTEASYEMPEPTALFAALARLSPRQRASVVLHYYAGYHLGEIAAMLGLTKATVSVHLMRGRRRLRRLLEESDD